jgi:hypothetical protein
MRPYQFRRRKRPLSSTELTNPERVSDRKAQSEDKFRDARQQTMDPVAERDSFLLGLLKKSDVVGHLSRRLSRSVVETRRTIPFGGPFGISTACR